jgi:tRNA A37 threonylcarbamoyladenosine modification protein TsaB
MKINLLCIELAYDFCSIALKKNDQIYYKEYINTSQTTKNLIQAIDLILLEGNLTYKNIDFIVFGDYPNNLINLKALTITVQSLSFIWKIPIVKFYSLLSISFEAFSLYKNSNVLTIVSNEKNKLFYCKSIFKECFLSSFFFKELTLINELDFKEFENFFFIINCEKSVINFIKSNYKFIKIKENILPKAIYTTSLIEKLILDKNEIKKNNMKVSYLKVKQYIKYKY